MFLVCPLITIEEGVLSCVFVPCSGDRGVSTDPARPPFLLVLYQQYLSHQDSACFVREVSSLYTTGTLQRLARHACREVRRAAVLALGFLGDYEANHTLGCALLDDDRTVRTLAENGIRTIWARAGNEAERQELGAIIRLNAAQTARTTPSAGPPS